MPRVKTADQIASLDRERSDLLAKLKSNKAKAAQKKREAEDRKALIAGRAIVHELAENSASPEAAAIRAVLSKRLTRGSDRDALGLPALLAQAPADPEPEMQKTAPEPEKPKVAPVPEMVEAATPPKAQSGGFLGSLTARLAGSGR